MEVDWISSVGASPLHQSKTSMATKVCRCANRMVNRSIEFGSQGRAVEEMYAGLKFDLGGGEINPPLGCHLIHDKD
jgi:hypothetical protein